MMPPSWLRAPRRPSSVTIVSSMLHRSLWFLSLALMAGFPAAPAAQSRNAPRNDLPQPYRTTRDWGQLPAGTTKWAAVTAVEPSPDGSIYVVHRCFDNSCAG